MLNNDLLALTWIGRFILAAAGVAIGWLASSGYDLLRAIPRKSAPDLRKISDLFAGSEMVHIAGHIEATRHHVAECSGAKSVQSVVTIYTKSGSHPETWWLDTKFVIFRHDAYRITDGTGTISVPEGMSVKGLQMVSVECAAEEIGQTISDRLLIDFGPSAREELKGKRVRLDEFFLPVGAKVYARCHVRSNGTVVVADVSLSPYLPAESRFNEVRFSSVTTALMAVVSVALIAAAIAF
jgi:hypothetical protein